MKIKYSTVFLIIGIGIIVLTRRMPTVDPIWDELTFYFGLASTALGLYFLNKERKDNPNVDDF